MDGDGKTFHPVMDGVQLGIGTWAWGDRLFWGYGTGYGDADLRQAFDVCIQYGISFFDTAEVYGQGKSEILLGEFIRESGKNVRVATKFMPYPWRLSRGALKRALRGSLKRLGLNQVDLYQMHWPNPPISIPVWMEAMEEVVHDGLTRAVGVSNYDRRQTQQAFETLARGGVPLATNQVEYHLLDRKIEKNGLLKHCQELGIKVIAYSPLGSGLLTGKYTPEQPPQGFRGNRFTRAYLTKIQPLIHLLERIGSDRGGKTVAQTALNWVICKGAVPIPGVKTVRQADQNAGALGWSLTESDVAALDEMSDRVAKE